jgi:hypothetical protein
MLPNERVLGVMMTPAVEQPVWRRAHRVKSRAEANALGFSPRAPVRSIAEISFRISNAPRRMLELKESAIAEAWHRALRTRCIRPPHRRVLRSLSAPLRS